MPPKTASPTRSSSPKRRKSKSPKTKRRYPGWAESGNTRHPSGPPSPVEDDSALSSELLNADTARGPTTLHTMATCANDVSAVAELLKGGPLLGSLWSACHACADHPVSSVCHADDLDLEVDAVDAEGFTALTYAAKCGHHLFVQGLCEHGASIDLHPTGPGGLTPLSECCFYMNVYLNAPATAPAAETGCATANSTSPKGRTSTRLVQSGHGW